MFFILNARCKLSSKLCAQLCTLFSQFLTDFFIPLFDLRGSKQLVKLPTITCCIVMSRVQEVMLRIRLNITSLLLVAVHNVTCVALSAGHVMQHLHSHRAADTFNCPVPDVRLEG